ncbi:MAG TPA: ABC transporter permease, partial [Anaerovoracaceae bacterium]|nr:ABC transporter permease [Anaerovoracaceae bacterium]
KPLIILIFIPICFSVLFGASMSPVFVDEIPIAVLDMDESSASREIIDEVKACSGLNIVEMADSSEQIKEDILMGTIKGGLIFPEGFGKDIAEHKGTKALMLIDGSNFMIGNNLMLYADKIFSNKNYELQISYMESGGMVAYSSDQNINTLSLADRTLYNPQIGYFYYLYPGLLGVFIQQTYLSALVPVLLEEKNRLKLMPVDRMSRRIRARKMVPLILQYAGLSFICSLSCMLIVHWLFAYPLEGSLFLTLVLQVIFLACLTGMAFVLAAIFDDVTHCAQFVMFLAIPTMLSSGYGWPVFMMAPGFATVMKMVWPLYYYNNPLKELMLKGSEFYAIDNFILGGIIFAAFWIPAGMWIYRQKIRTMRQIEDIQNLENVER